MSLPTCLFSRKKPPPSFLLKLFNKYVSQNCLKDFKTWVKLAEVCRSRRAGGGRLGSSRAPPSGGLGGCCVSVHPTPPRLDLRSVCAAPSIPESNHWSSSNCQSQDTSPLHLARRRAWRLPLNPPAVNQGPWTRGVRPKHPNHNHGTAFMTVHPSSSSSVPVWWVPHTFTCSSKSEPILNGSL